MAFKPEAFMACMNIQAILPCKIAAGKTEIMNGIKQVCFSYTITATDANNPFCKLKLFLEIILELEK